MSNSKEKKSDFFSSFNTRSTNTKKTMRNERFHRVCEENQSAHIHSTNRVENWLFPIYAISFRLMCICPLAIAFHLTLPF